MAREYPRFLFSDPQNTKSLGPFIVHNLHPRAIFKVITMGREPAVYLIELFDQCSQDTERSLSVDAVRWLRAQIEERQINYSSDENFNKM
jgi:hypothetical protein